MKLNGNERRFVIRAIQRSIDQHAAQTEEDGVALNVDPTALIARVGEYARADITAEESVVAAAEIAANAKSAKSSAK